MPQILLVEDNETNRIVLTRRLRATGHSVVLARDGEQACALAQTLRPDLIVVDLALPGSDGLNVTRLLRSNDSTRAVPIIVLTSRPATETREKAFEVGCDDYAVKPIAFTQLNGKIEGLLFR